MYNNLPTNTSPTLAATAFNQQYSQPLELDAGTFSMMKGFFEKRGFEKLSAEMVAVTLIRQAKQDGYNPLEVLDTMKEFDDANLNTVVAELINYNRFKSSYLGNSTANVPFNPVYRNVVDAGEIPTYTIETSSTVVNEGNQVTFTIFTQFVNNGSLFYWTMSGAGIIPNDFVGNAVTGTVEIFNNRAEVTVTLSADQITEGNEILIFRLRKRSVAGAIVASASVLINDVSFSTVADFMVIEYTFDTGSDLDTRTRVAIPPLSDSNGRSYTGWGQAVEIQNVLQFGNDNTGIGRESSVFKIADFRQLYPAEANVLIDCRAQWYGTVGTTPVGLKITLYTGGTIQKTPDNFGFQNPTATSSKVLDLTLKFITLQSTNGQSIGQRIATISYNVNNGIGSINPNDVTVYP